MIRVPDMTPAAVRHALPAAILLSLAGMTAAQTPFFGSREGDPLAPLTGAFSCPLDRLTDLYASLTPEEIPSLLEIESEVLLICSERQERLLAILRAEMELRELMDIAPPGPGSDRISVADSSLARSSPLAACGPTEGQNGPMPAGGIAAPGPAGNGRDGGAAAAALLAAVLERLTTRDAGNADSSGNACAVWSWAWTLRDAQGRPAAGLRSPEGEAMEVREQDRLPGGLTVIGITAGGVSLSDGAGKRIELPRSSEPAPRTSADEPEAGPPAGLPPEIAERLGRVMEDP